MSNTLLAGATTATATTTTNAIDRLSQQYASQRSGTSSTSSSSSTSKTTGTASGMGQDAFLKMFMAQMTNQNPLDPMDNTEFTAQLAQFSSLEQLTKINKSLEGLTSLQDSMTQAQVLGYLGKEVTMSGNQLQVTDGSAGSASYTLAANASVKAVITDANGTVVATKDLGYQYAGTRSFEWDATTLSGGTAEDGSYRVSFQATDNDGSSVKVSDVSISGLVTGYKKGSDGTTYLLMGDREVKLSTVTGVRQPSSSSTTSESLNTLYNSYLNSTSNASGGQSFSDWLNSLVS